MTHLRRLSVLMALHGIWRTQHELVFTASLLTNRSRICARSLINPSVCVGVTVLWSIGTVFASGGVSGAITDAIAILTNWAGVCACTLIHPHLAVSTANLRRIAVFLTSFRVRNAALIRLLAANQSSKARIERKKQKKKPKNGNVIKETHMIPQSKK